MSRIICFFLGHNLEGVNHRYDTRVKCSRCGIAGRMVEDWITWRTWFEKD